MKTLKIAASVIAAISVIWFAGFNVNNHFAKQSFVLAGFAESNGKQLKFERRSLNRDIYDLETALDNKRLSPALREKYKERLFQLYQQREEVNLELTGGGK